MDYSILDNLKSKKLIKKFKRKLPREDIYLDRLCEELELIIRKGFDKHLKLVIKILDLINDIPHIIRGSSGSCLVCYCLGITNIDPVKEKISFARFLNDKRENMPDIDMDFPYHLREKVFERIEDRFPNRVGRISNHLYYREKSALRQAFRECGYRKLIPKNRLSINYLPELRDQVVNKYEELKNEFRGYSLHCGGIVIYKKNIPREIILKNNQIIYNKDDVAKKELFKIDILSNRGLAQLYSISNKDIEDYPEKDINISKLFRKGKNIGLTFGESPAMRKVLKIVKPENIQQLALCLALIRPAASGGSYNKKDLLLEASRGNLDDFIIYDDDAIESLQRWIKCDSSTADQYRKAFSKNKYQKINHFKKILETFDYDIDKKKHIYQSLNDLNRYSFCKSHAISYAKLVWCLAYQKVYQPIKFWLSYLNHCNSSYRDWVGFRSLVKHGIKLTIGKRPWLIKDNILISKKNSDITKYFIINKIDSLKEYYQYGYWTNKKFLDNCYKKKDNNKISFRGLIALGRIYKNKCTFVTIGYKNDKYLDLIINERVCFYYYHFIEGFGLIDKFNNINVIEYKLIK